MGLYEIFHGQGGGIKKGKEQAFRLAVAQTEIFSGVI